MEKKHAEERKPAKPKTPTFLLELPLEVQAGQAAHGRHPARSSHAFHQTLPILPRVSFAFEGAEARLPKSPSEAKQELLFLSSRGKVEAGKHHPEPPVR